MLDLNLPKLNHVGQKFKNQPTSMSVIHGLINFMDTKAKCRLLKKSDL